MNEKNNNSGEEREKEVIDLQAVADDNAKRSGEAVEAAFLASVCRLRIPVCKPWGDSERYDFVVDWRIGFWRVQVKGGSCLERGRYKVGPGGSGKPFTKEDMDFVVVHIVPEDLWYVVPIEIAEGLSTLWFNPRSTRGRFEKDREAWCLLDCPRKVRGRGDIPVRCRSEELKVRCAVCPLRGQEVAEVKIQRRRG
jgi:PD-(D/E)XK endonuclease